MNPEITPMQVQHIPMTLQDHLNRYKEDGVHAHYVDIAKACHEANRAYCTLLGDHSQLPWDEAQDWVKESAINGVLFHLKNPSAGPEGSHEHRVRDKTAAGWKYGPEKNVEKKEHPCMVPYSELPLEQQFKDAMFVAIVHALKA